MCCCRVVLKQSGLLMCYFHSLFKQGGVVMCFLPVVTSEQGAVKHFCVCQNRVGWYVVASCAKNGWIGNDTMVCHGVGWLCVVDMLHEIEWIGNVLLPCCVKTG